MEQKLEQKSDEELFQLLGSDKETAERAFTELYNRYSGQVYAFCRRFIGHREEAQDIFQETFIRFHQTIDKNMTMTNVLGYLLTIARNLCYNIKRDEKYTVTYEDYLSVTDDNRNETDELLNLVKRGIELLPKDIRELFILREYDGLSYSEIAEITESNMNTVKVKLFRAKKKLRKILEPYMEDLSDYE
ncbi:RNA polymerase sigma factor [Bacteroidota bacterium]